MIREDFDLTHSPNLSNREKEVDLQYSNENSKITLLCLSFYFLVVFKILSLPNGKPEFMLIDLKLYKFFH